MLEIRLLLSKQRDRHLACCGFGCLRAEIPDFAAAIPGRPETRLVSGFGFPENQSRWNSDLVRGDEGGRCRNTESSSVPKSGPGILLSDLHWPVALARPGCRAVPRQNKAGFSMIAVVLGPFEPLQPLSSPSGIR